MDLVELAKHGPHAPRHPWELARRKIVTEWLKKRLHARGLKQDAFVMDVGSGDAYLVASISQSLPTHQYAAYDKYYTPELLAQVRDLYAGHQNLKIDTTIAPLVDRQQKINFILLFDVIEHIEDEINFLKELAAHDLIDSSTEFLITIPAFQSLYTAHDDFLEHYRRYDTRMLTDRLAQAGLSIDQSHYFFFLPLLFRSVQKLKENIFGRPQQQADGISAWSGGKLVTSGMTSLLMMDYRISSLFRKIGIKLPGLSLCCLARPDSSQN